MGEENEKTVYRVLFILSPPKKKKLFDTYHKAQLLRPLWKKAEKTLAVPCQIFFLFFFFHLVTWIFNNRRPDIHIILMDSLWRLVTIHFRAIRRVYMYSVIQEQRREQRPCVCTCMYVCTYVCTVQYIQYKLYLYCTVRTYPSTTRTANTIQSSPAQYVLFAALIHTYVEAIFSFGLSRIN